MEGKIPGTDNHKLARFTSYIFSKFQNGWTPWEVTQDLVEKGISHQAAEDFVNQVHAFQTENPSAAKEFIVKKKKSKVNQRLYAGIILIFSGLVIVLATNYFPIWLFAIGVILLIGYIVGLVQTY